MREGVGCAVETAKGISNIKLVWVFSNSRNQDTTLIRTSYRSGQDTLLIRISYFSN